MDKEIYWVSASSLAIHLSPNKSQLVSAWTKGIWKSHIHSVLGNEDKRKTENGVSTNSKNAH